MYFLKCFFFPAILNLALLPGGTVFLQKAKEHMGRKQLLGSLQCTNDAPEGGTKVLLWHKQKGQ